VADMNLLVGASDPFAASVDTVAAARRLLLGLPAGRRILVSRPDELDSALGTGRATIGLARTNDVATLIRRGRPVEWIVPTEGATAIARTWSIPVGASRTTCAYRWLQTVLQPETQAAFAQLTGLAPTAPAACAILVESWCQLTGASVTGLVSSLHIDAPPPQAAVTGDLGAAWNRVVETTPSDD
jgi:putative spermidine/putrescine transport system substrate-binding protein